MTATNEALLLVLVMGGVIFFCRVFPLLFFRTDNFLQDSGKGAVFIGFVEKTVPPVAMTVLAFNAIAGSFGESARQPLPLVIAVVFTAVAHLWRRNALISIFGGTGLYILLNALSG